MKSPRKFHLFSAGEVEKEFLSDLRVLCHLKAAQRTELARFYGVGVDLFSDLENQKAAELAKQLSTETDAIEAVHRLTRFVAQNFALHDLSDQQLHEDLKLLIRRKDELESIQSFFQTILKKRPTLKKEALGSLSANATVDSIRGANFSLDMRAVYQDGGAEILDLVPVLLVKIQLDGRDRREVVFQLSKEKLDQFCTMLDQQKAKMKNLVAKTKLSP